MKRVFYSMWCDPAKSTVTSHRGCPGWGWSKLMMRGMKCACQCHLQKT